MKKDLTARQFRRASFTWNDGETSEIGVRLMTGRSYASLVSAHAPSVLVESNPAELPEITQRRKLDAQRVAEVVVKQHIVDPDDNTALFTDESVALLSDDELTALFNLIMEAAGVGAGTPAVAAFRS